MRYFIGWLIERLIGLVPPIPRFWWAVDDLADLPDNVDLTKLPSGAGLSNDRAAVWTEKVGSAAAVIVGRVPGGTAGTFTPFRRSLHQLNGHQVDAYVGGMNESHTMAVAAASLDPGAGSLWALQVQASGGETWLNPNGGMARHQATDIDTQGWIVGTRQDVRLVSCYWDNVGVAAPVDLPQLGFETAALAVSPTGRHLAGFWNTVEANGPRQPWFGTPNGEYHLTYVDGLATGTAFDINDDETSCGQGIQNDSTMQRAWTWSKLRGTTWLGGLVVDGAELDSAAYSLNRYGEMVGRSGNRAVYWSPYRQAPVDLTAELGQSGLQLTTAVRINDNRDILCFGTFTPPKGPTVQKVFLVRYAGRIFRLG